MEIFIRGTIFGVIILSVTLFGVTIFGVTISGTIFGVTIFENTNEIRSNLSWDFSVFCLGRTRNLVSQHLVPQHIGVTPPQNKNPTGSSASCPLVIF